MELVIISAVISYHFILTMSSHLNMDLKKCLKQKEINERKKHKINILWCELRVVSGFRYNENENEKKEHLFIEKMEKSNKIINVVRIGHDSVVQFHHFVRILIHFNLNPDLCTYLYNVLLWESEIILRKEQKFMENGIHRQKRIEI